ncbi:MAG: cytochrome c [Planctomycetes bacterium]|nr:cytochrome c [Planctomycetota bacterium]
MRTDQTDRARSIGFWPSCCARFTKELLILGLVWGFIMQTCLVYSDLHETVKLSDVQVEGRRIWHRRNCQTCHQLHGFGGFLGPDLTNATERLQRRQLDDLLTGGFGQMPAFHLTPDEIDAVWAYLTAMNETGIGQARNPNLDRLDDLDEADGESSRVATPGLALRQVVGESGDEVVAHGFELFRSRSCLSCHVLFGRSAVGAPDLSLSGMRLSADEIDTVLSEGRPPKMPTPVLTRQEREHVREFIVFMADHRFETLARVETKRGAVSSALPWWEYR